MKLNKKMRSKALAVVLSKKLQDLEILFVTHPSFSEPKTKTAKDILKALATGSGQATLATKRKNAALVVIPRRDLPLEKSFRNFGNIEVAVAKDINPVDVMTYKYVIVTDPNASCEILKERITPAAKATK